MNGALLTTVASPDGPGAGPESAPSPDLGRRVAAPVLLALAWAWVLACPLGIGVRSAEAGKPRGLPEGPVIEIRFQGNEEIKAQQIQGHIKTRIGRELDRETLDGDVRALSATKWFADVRAETELDPQGKGVILIFVVSEMPTLPSVEFIGRSAVKLKEIEETSGLKRGKRADWYAVQGAVERIRRLYFDKGYEMAEVKLLEGGKPGDKRIRFEIAEGPKFHIQSIDFVGNTFVDDSVLATKIESRCGWFGTRLGERRFENSTDNDRRALIKFYQDHGFFDVDVSVTVRQGAQIGQEQITFTISEKTRYKVDKIVFEGNDKIPSATLAASLLMKPGDYYNEGIRDTDFKSVLSKYWAIGCIKTAVERDQPLTPDKPGHVNVTYKISEGSPYYLGQLIFKGNVHTKDRVFRREAVMAGLLPGEVLDLNRFDKFRQRLLSTGYVYKDTQPGISKALDIQIVNERTADKPYGLDVFVDPTNLPPSRLQSPDLDLPPLPARSATAKLDDPALTPAPDLPSLPLGGPSTVRKRPTVVPAALAAEAAAQARLDAERPATPRMQSPGEPTLTLPGDPPTTPPLTIGPVGGDIPTAIPDPAGAGSGASAAPGSGPAAAPGLAPFGRVGDTFAPPPNSVPTVPALPGPPVENPGPNPKNPRTNGPVDSGDRNPGLFPNTPNLNMTDVGPDRQEPYGNRSFADLVTTLDEAPTGRLMLGLGASSFGGLNASIIVHESDFDITAIPRSWGELTSGRAFRGAGQEFRLELMPGTLINRYTVSFRDPYLFDLPIGLGLQGYQWSRYYPDWSEQRSGGRFSLGYQLGPQTYSDVAFRVENVGIHGFKYPAPADVLAVQGNTFLATIRPSLRFDNRNNPNAPTEGSYLEAAFEQGWGNFTFPKVTLEGRQHFTLGARPDNTGKRTLALRGFFGATGRDTPVYERFYAGDFRSMRGFYYRGVGPHVLGVNTGGILTAIGSVEYQFPWNASDTVQQVIFCDFGTVEADYRFTTFRAAVGTGLRVVIPQITGQLPLSFDIAVPVSKAEGDRERLFSFFIGAFW